MDALAQRWHIPPSAVLTEPAWLVRGIAMLEQSEDAVSPDDEMSLMLEQRAVVDG